MNIYLLAMVVVTSVLGLIYEMNHRAEQSAQSVDVSMIARSVLVYRNALAEYAYAHSTESGAVPDNVLDLPTWYARYPGVSGVISAGKSYAFFGSPPSRSRFRDDQFDWGIAGYRHGVGWQPSHPILGQPGCHAASDSP